MPRIIAHRLDDTCAPRCLAAEATSRAALPAGGRAPVAPAGMDRRLQLRPSSSAGRFTLSPRRRLGARGRLHWRGRRQPSGGFDPTITTRRGSGRSSRAALDRFPLSLRPVAPLVNRTQVVERVGTLGRQGLHMIDLVGARLTAQVADPSVPCHHPLVASLPFPARHLGSSGIAVAPGLALLPVLGTTRLVR